MLTESSNYKAKYINKVTDAKCHKHRWLLTWRGLGDSPKLIGQLWQVGGA